MAGSHKAAICRAASAAVGVEMQKFVDDGLLSDTQNQDVISAHETHIHTLTDIAANIVEPEE